METLVGSAPVLNWEATDLESSWKSFRSHVDFMFSGPLKEKSEEEQCSYLMLWVGEKGRNIYSTWGMSVEDKKKLKNYYENFEKYVKPRSNVIYNRYKFQQCVQGPETFEQFTTTLHVLVKDCQYHNSEEMVRDRIVFGVRSHKIREKLIAVGSDLTLAKALDIARTYELSQAQMKTMSGEDPKVVNVVRNKTKHVYPNKVNERYQASGSSKKEYSQSQKECYKCGYKHVPNKCPAHGKTCMKCKKLNHFASKCKSKMKKVHQITDDFDSDSEEELFIGAVDKVAEQVSTDSDWSVNLKVENKSVRLQVDTGAKCNVISFNTLQRTKPNSKVRPTSTPLKSFSGHTMKPKGTVTLRCEYKGQIHSIEFYVLDQPVPAVLGAETCTKLNIVKRVYSVHEKETFDTKNYSDLFEGLGCLPGTYSIKLKADAKPIVHPPRKVPMALKEKTTAWHWLDGQEKSFQELKTLAINAPALSYFNPALPITLNVDASSKGLGAVLMQEDKPVAYASRALTTTQQKYAQIEKETLAIVYGCTKFHQYLFGQKFEVESDHRPLQSIFSKPLQKAPSRLQRFLMTLQKYDFQVKYKPGKSMYISDTLSRFSLNETIEQLVPEIEVNALNLTAYLPMSPDKYTSLQKATRDDHVMQTLQKTILEGWPEEKSDISVSIREYWNFRDEISCVDDILYKGHKLIVPNEMREEMLKLVHQSHLGIVKCKSRAREVIFWPGMSAQIEELVGRCETCAQYHSMNQKEPMMTTELPDRPWSKVGADLFQFKGEHYLLTIDYYSKWPEISLLEDLSSSCTIRHMKSQFAKYGIVDELISDNGPQFSCNEFTKFSNEYGFKHTTVSPHYQQANGQAERTVRTMKNLLKKANDPYQALMDYRNTPLQDLLLSPAQLFLGRRLKTSLPTTKPLLQQMKPQNIQSSLQKRQEKQELNYNKYCSKKPLPSLQEGDSVLMNKDKTWVPATVERKHQTPRSYVVKDNTGRKYRRNRKHLRKTLIRAEETRTTECEDSEISTDQGEPARRIQTPRSTDSSSPRHTTRSTDSSSPRHITRSADSTSHQQVTRSGRVVKTPEKFTDYVK